MGRKHRKPRKPFDWLNNYSGRRGALQAVRKAIREGWMDGLEHADRREQLVAAIARLPLERMETRETLQVCGAYIDMRVSNIAMIRAALDAEIASYRLHGTHAPQRPCRER